MQHSRSLTSGPTGAQLLYLAIPLLLGNIFQQLYNFAAAIIVGRYVGEAAFAAIGVGGTVMNLFIFILTGCSIGVSIIIASMFGKGDFHGLRKECFLALIFGGAFTIFVSAVSVYFLPSVLRAIHTPAEIFGATGEYLRIILGGLLATFYYNLGASALRAVGNTRYALVFLVTAVILNAALTFVLVAWFGFGIAGAAWATVFSQGLSAVLCMVYIRKKLPFMVPAREDMKYDGRCKNGTLRLPLRHAPVSSTWENSWSRGGEPAGHSLHRRLYGHRRMRVLPRGRGELLRRHLRIRCAKHGRGRQKKSAEGISHGFDIPCVPQLFYFDPSVHNSRARSGPLRGRGAKRGRNPGSGVHAVSRIFLRLLLYRQLLRGLLPGHGEDQRALYRHHHPDFSQGYPVVSSGAGDGT